MTSSRSGPVPTESSAPVAKPEKTKNAAPFRLVLSAPATEVVLSATNEIRTGAAGGGVSGTLEIDPANPAVSLSVRWKNPPAPGEHRFAKLTLEAAGQDTFNHVFDAGGDIDDFLELPIAK
ncbi:hypothetical protein GCM10023212_02830 [Luteolibacter yonseiensis]